MIQRLRLAAAFVAAISLLVLAGPARAQAAGTAFTAGTGQHPDVAVDAAGTAHVVWLQPSGSTNVVAYCRVPRGQRACTGTQTFALDLEDIAGRPWVFVNGATVTIVDHRCCNDETFALTSSDGGKTFGSALTAPSTASRPSRRAARSSSACRSRARRRPPGRTWARATRWAARSRSWAGSRSWRSRRSAVRRRWHSRAGRGPATRTTSRPGRRPPSSAPATPRASRRAERHLPDEPDGRPRAPAVPGAQVHRQRVRRPFPRGRRRGRLRERPRGGRRRRAARGLAPKRLARDGALRVLGQRSLVAARDRPRPRRRGLRPHRRGRARPPGLGRLGPELAYRRGPGGSAAVRLAGDEGDLRHGRHGCRHARDPEGLRQRQDAGGAAL